RQLQAPGRGLFQRGVEQAAGLGQITLLLCLLGAVQRGEDHRTDRLLSHTQCRCQQQSEPQQDVATMSDSGHGYLPSRRKYRVLVASRATGCPFSRRGANRQRAAARRASRSNTPRGSAWVTRRFSTRPSAVMVKARVTSPSMPAASARWGQFGGISTSGVTSSAVEGSAAGAAAASGGAAGATTAGASAAVNPLSEGVTAMLIPGVGRLGTAIFSCMLLSTRGCCTDGGCGTSGGCGRSGASRGCRWRASLWVSATLRTKLIRASSLVGSRLSRGGMTSAIIRANSASATSSPPAKLTSSRIRCLPRWLPGPRRYPRPGPPDP